MFRNTPSSAREAGVEFPGPVFHDRAGVEAQVKAGVEATVRAFVEGDYDDFFALCDPIVVAMLGGRERACRYLRSQVEEMASQDFVFSHVVIDQPLVFYRAGDELQALVRYTAHCAGPQCRTSSGGYMIGISQDDGATWLYVGGTDAEERDLRHYFPNLSPDMEFPPDEDLEVFPAD